VVRKPTASIMKISLMMGEGGSRGGSGGTVSPCGGSGTDNSRSEMTRGNSETDIAREMSVVDDFGATENEIMDTSVLEGGGSDEEELATSTARGEGEPLSSTKKKNKGRKLQRKKNKKKGWNDQEGGAFSGWTAAVASTQWPTVRRNFTSIKKLVAGSFLFLLGWIGQGYSGGSVSAHLTPSSGPSVSSNNKKQTERSAPVFAPPDRRTSLTTTREVDDAPEGCPPSTVESPIIGTQVTIGRTVYECFDSPCKWMSVGSCEDDIFVPSASSSQRPTLRPGNLFQGTTTTTPPSENAQGLENDPLISLLPSQAATSSALPTTSSLPTAHPSSSSIPTSSSQPSISLVPTPPPPCEGANPETCGCTSVKQRDYRGSINTTKSGVECMKWDQALSDEQMRYYPDAGLKDNNFCRNPYGDDRAGCLTTGGNFEYCDVPTCEDSLPSAPPSSSALPASSSQPSTSLVSTTPPPPPACEGANPKTCGCASVRQADYRGSISATKSGVECLRWDQALSDEQMRYYPDAGLEDNNFCRNQDGDDRAWCRTEDYWEYCDVPICKDSLPSASSSSSSQPSTSQVPTSQAIVTVMAFCVMTMIMS